MDHGESCRVTERDHWNIVPNSTFLNPNVEQRVPKEIKEQWRATTKVLSRPDKEAMHCLSRLESPMQLRVRLKTLMATHPCVSDHPLLSKQLSEIDQMLPLSSKKTTNADSEFFQSHLSSNVPSPLFHDGSRHKISQRHSTLKLKIEGTRSSGPSTKHFPSSPNSPF